MKSSLIYVQFPCWWYVWTNKSPDDYGESEIRRLPDFSWKKWKQQRTSPNLLNPVRQPTQKSVLVIVMACIYQSTYTRALALYWAPPSHIRPMARLWHKRLEGQEMECVAGSRRTVQGAMFPRSMLFHWLSARCVCHMESAPRSRYLSYRRNRCCCLPLSSAYSMYRHQT